ncbi:ester cyclase [Flavobacteriaceae bacterium S356]|uniref:Ester cyclase n=1 Tax=Asprobacillus argus TaxID=3076534 RepID=A0ABU3LF63_9FLAO|nr:ester cyclase [Flavobacteriaceae bacterium S356]
MLEKNKETVRRYFTELWEKQNFDIIDQVFTKDFTGHLVNPSKGKEGIQKNVLIMKKAFPNGRLEIDDLFGEADNICIRWRYVGKHEGEFMGISPTGKDIVLKGITIERFENGKIAELWAEMDIYDLLKQLGVINM